jgi:RES domain-containing protein
VPSAIVETEANYLLNPVHAAFASVKVSAPVPFELDARLVAAIRKS